MFPSFYQHCKGKGEGPLAETGNALMAGRASFRTKLISLNKFCRGIVDQTEILKLAPLQIEKKAFYQS